MPRDLLPELPQGFRVGRDAIVLEVPREDLPQPATLLRDGIVTPAFQLAFDLLEFGPQALGDRVAYQHESSLAGSTTDMREPEERDRFGLTLSLFVAVQAGEPTEPNQPGLLGMKFQLKLLHPLSQLCEEFPSICFLLESNDSIIRETDDDDITRGVVLAPVLGPQVEHIVQVHVCQ